jgi:ABC-type transporter Mla subunit MlaD
MSGLGYFYEGFDAFSGAKALVRAFETHDQNLSATAAANRRFLDQFSPHLDSNRESWLRALRFLQKMPSKTG